MIALEFEWDQDKRILNFKKHRVDFADAVRIFNGPVVEWLDERESYGEDRYIGLGELDGRMVLNVAYTVRGVANEVIRMISARKATKYESKIYYQETEHQQPPGW